ncbi:MAG TPA: hemerythrin domain-containing protein [Nitrospiraceae bacterium]|nr:hemerythrin domain-containing protein [Nitrospiraceae bacterium]
MPGPTISQFFTEDHDELDALLGSFQSQKYTNYGKAKEAFREFKAGLERHIVWEEQLLFPLWEEKTGMADSGPTFVMRGEHRHIGERLEAILRKVQNEDPDTGIEEQALIVLLSAHNMKEERVLYPSIDKLVADDEREKLYEKMKAMSEEQYKACCWHEQG